MPQPFTVESQEPVRSPLATFDSAGNLVIAGKLTQNGAVRGDQVIVPPGTTAGVLQVANNLSDVPNPAAARINLGISSGSGIYPPSGYGLKTLSIDPMACQANSGINNQIWATRLFVPAGTTITALWAAVRTAGTWDAATHPNQLGLYTDAGVQVDTTADDGTLWTQTGWRGGNLQGGTQASQTSDRFVYVLISVRGMTGLVIPFPSNAADANGAYAAVGISGANNRRTMYAAGAASLPASFDPTAYGTSTGFLPAIGTS